jgi:hypothetical protein
MRQNLQILPLASEERNLVRNPHHNSSERLKNCQPGLIELGESIRAARDQVCTMKQNLEEGGSH